jgi:hypothetical protein
MLSGKTVNWRVVVGIVGRRSGGMWLLWEFSGQILYVCSCYSQFIYLYILAKIMNRYSLSHVRLSVCLFGSVISQFTDVNPQAASVRLYYPSGTAAGHKDIMLNVSSETLSKM